MKVALLLFEDFQTLDVFGPVEIFGRLIDQYSIKFYSLEGGLIQNKHGVSILSEKLDTLNYNPSVFLIPGGIGTRKEVNNHLLLKNIKDISINSEFVLTVCTGSALLARTGLLENKKATSNKRAMEWVMTNGTNVLWDKNTRWTVDGKYYTSSGVSAGIDMCLGFLHDRHGIEFARRVAAEIEYRWNEYKDEDFFNTT
jgi:putative intracellular protease/amidase